MADFGKGGKRTIRTHDGAVLVSISNGEYLAYKLTVQGAVPLFTFACKHTSRKSQNDFPGHPKAVYEWTWSHNSDESDAPDDNYGVAMLFISALKYTLFVEHRRQDNTVIKVLQDIDYESKEHADSFTEILRVFIS
ncbi:MAG TPA: hypothetical protein VN696_10125 [Pyrinomonadaceae bacterium]|nr:hypothetical protein [Pyrinomonadaceae bacterium]